MSLAQRTWLSFASIFLVSLVAGVVVLQARDQRQQSMSALMQTYETSARLSELERCIADRHREITLLVQTLVGAETPSVAASFKGDFAAKLNACKEQARDLAQLAKSDRTAHRAEIDRLAQAGLTLIEDWGFVLDNLGKDYVAAIERQAVRADPAALLLMDDLIPATRVEENLEMTQVRQEFQQTAEHADSAVFFFLGGTCVLLALVGGSVARRIGAALHALSVGMERFGAGDFDFRVELPGQDELSVVAARINAMADELATSQIELEKRAEELESTVRHLQDTQSLMVQQEKLAALGGLVAGLAHEVNTPIGVAVTTGSMIEEHVASLAEHAEQGTATRRILRESTQKLQAAIEPMLSNLARAAHLVQSFKQVSVDRNVLTTRTIRLEELVHAIAQALSPMLKKNGCELSVELTCDAEVVVAVGELEQVITNLIVNACVHGYGSVDANVSSASGQKHRIALRVGILEQHLLVDVEDEGVGMAPEIYAKVFEPFFSTGRARGGTGLGMHIVHQLVTERFAGRIEAQTAPGEGTCWNVRLPLNTTALHLSTSAGVFAAKM